MNNNFQYWSRRITSKHRLIYSVNSIEIKVVIISIHEYYDEK